MPWFVWPAMVCLIYSCFAVYSFSFHLFSDVPHVGMELSFVIFLTVIGFIGFLFVQVVKDNDDKARSDMRKLTEVIVELREENEKLKAKYEQSDQDEQAEQYEQDENDYF